MLPLSIKDTSNQEHIDQLIAIKQFLFMYNGMNDANLLPGHNINKFVPS